MFIFDINRPSVKCVPRDANNLLSASVYLFDSGDPPVEPLPCANVFTIASCSPNKAHYKSFLNRHNAVKTYMPCWSKEELQRTGFVDAVVSFGDNVVLVIMLCV